MNKDITLRLEKSNNEYTYQLNLNGYFTTLPRNKMLFTLLQFKLPDTKGKLASGSEIQFISIDGCVENFTVPEMKLDIREEFFSIQEWVSNVIDKISTLESELIFEGEI